MARNKKMTLVAAKKPQLKRRAARDWSIEKAEAFLRVLMETCNVSQACRTSGVPMTVAYRRRKMDARFRASWIEAIAIGYQRLEALLLDRCFNGSEKLITRKDGSEERVREYPNQIALHLLKMHRETAQEDDRQMSNEEVAELRERLVNKLQRLKKRNEDEEAERERLRGSGPDRNGPAGERDAGAAA